MFIISHFDKLKKVETNSYITKILIHFFLVVEGKDTLQLKGVTEEFYAEYFLQL